MKKALFCMLTLLVVATAFAVPARRGVWRTLALENGDTVRAQLVGDEHLHFWQDAGGNRYVRGGARGVYRLADMAQLRRKAFERRQRASSPRRPMPPLGQGPGGGKAGELRRTLFQGKKRGLIILVEFPNQGFSVAHPQALYDSIANTRGYSGRGFRGSISDYFRAQSGGQLTLDFDVAGPVMMAHDYGYYGRDDDAKVGEMVRDACLGVDGDVNFADYDWDGDGEAEEVFVLYAGHGQADYDNDDDDLIWPHKYNLSASEIRLALDDTRIDTYACANEINYEGKIGGIGTFCHEFSHCMGFPDVYDTGYSGNFGMGSWDLMDYGSYNGDGYLPCGYTAYEKMVCGWTVPEELNDDAEVTGMRPLADMGQTYIIYNEGNPDEYYLLENRQQVGFDAALPGHGLLVSHIDYNANVWYWNLVNTTTYPTFNNHQRITIFHADDDDDSGHWDATARRYTEQTEAGDPYPHEGNDSLTSNSAPVASVWQDNWDGSKLMGCAITGISEAGDGTVSFSFSPVSPVIGGRAEKADTLLWETFDQCKGSGGNDGRFSGNVASAVFEPDLDGWVADYAYGGNQCARFGNSKRTGLGMVSSPTFTLRGDTAVLTFRAAGWDATGDRTGLMLSLNGAGARFAETQSSDLELEMKKGEWLSYSVKIVGSGAAYLTFYPHKRFFLDDVLLLARPQAVTHIRRLANAPRRSAQPHNLLGQPVGRGYRGIVIQTGRKRVAR